MPATIYLTVADSEPVALTYDPAQGVWAGDAVWEPCGLPGPTDAAYFRSEA